VTELQRCVSADEWRVRWRCNT